MKKYYVGYCFYNPILSPAPFFSAMARRALVLYSRGTPLKSVIEDVGKNYGIPIDVNRLLTRLAAR